jgi:hypothetical protein
MKTYLSNLIRGNIEKVDGVNTISNEDAQIIYNLLYCIEKLAPELIEVIGDWKRQSDELTLDTLLDFVEKVESANRSGTTDSEINFVKLGDEWILAHLIRSAQFIMGFDSTDDDHPNRYNILINKTNNDKMAYANKVIEFYSEKQREIEFKKFQDKIKKFHYINFID